MIQKLFSLFAGIILGVGGTITSAGFGQSVDNAISTPIYANCTPVYDAIIVTATPIPTITNTPTLLPTGQPTSTTVSLRTLTLTPFTTPSTTPTIEAFVTIGVPPSPTPDNWVNKTFVVTAALGLKVRACAGTTCSQVGSLRYGDSIYVLEVVSDGVYLWGRIGATQWTALGTADGSALYVRRSS